MLVSSEEPNLFTGMTLLTPLFKLPSETEKIFDNLLPIQKIANTFSSSYKLFS